MNYQSLLQDKVEQLLKDENRYRHFVELERLTGRHPMPCGTIPKARVKLSYGVPMTI